MKSGTSFLVAVALIAGICYFSTRGSRVDALQYSSDFSQALQDARIDRKPILLNFGGSW